MMEESWARPSLSLFHTQPEIGNPAASGQWSSLVVITISLVILPLSLKGKDLPFVRTSAQFMGSSLSDCATAEKFSHEKFSH